MAQTQIGADIDGEALYDESGVSISMPDANTVAIGAIKNDGNGTNAGHVRIFDWNGSAWTQKGLDIDGEAIIDKSGIVSMPDANTVAIGALDNDGNGTNAGHVRIYNWNGLSWMQKGIDIDGEAPGDRAAQVDMPDSNTVAIGGVYNSGNGNDAGHVRIYSWNGSIWIQKGLDIDGEAVDDMSGISVSMSDSNTVAIGAPFNDGNGITAGHVRVYRWNGSMWIQKGLDLDGEEANDRFGNSVSMPDSNTVAIGGPGNNGNGLDSGHARIYTWNGGAWIQKGTDIYGENAGDISGWSLNMPDANSIAIGALYNDGNGANTGHVRVYRWNGSAWIQIGIDIDGEAAEDWSGYYVSMPDSNTVAIGAPYNDGNGIDAGHVRVYSFCPNTGTDIVSACDSYTWIDGNTYTGDNNTATYVSTNAAGCDSVVTLDLTINTVDVSVTNADPTLTSNATIADYQWIDCGDNNNALNGESNQSFTATSNGSYAVIVIQNGCSDTSICFTVSAVGLNKTTGKELILIVYPNSSSGMFTIEFITDINQNLPFTVTDMAGKAILEGALNKGKTTVDLRQKENGVYLLNLNDQVIRLVKE